MPTASGVVVKFDKKRLVATFELDDGPRHLCVDLKPYNVSFKCSKAKLTYETVEQLVGSCVWSGTVNRANVQLKQVGGGVTIVGPLETRPATSGLVNGTAMWTTGAAPSPDQPSGQLATGKGGMEANTSVTDPNPAAERERETARHAREAQLLQSRHPIIAIFGQSGVGKSTFINLISFEKQKVGRGLQSCTSEINVIEATISGKPIVVIDTPGIDDTRSAMKEADVLNAIASRLEIMGRKRIWLTGVLFLHRISDNKFSPTAARVSQMLKVLCGDDAMANLVLCTTMWDRVPDDEAWERFEELTQTGAWKEMTELGATTAQISNLNPDAKETAEQIVTNLMENETVKLRIQKQMIEEGKSVLDTDAGKVVDEHIKKVQEEAERRLKEEREAMRKEMEATAAKAQAAMDAQRLEVEKLRRQAERQGLDQQVLAERLQAAEKKAALEMKELEEKGAAEAMKLQEAIRAQEETLAELNRQREALAQKAKRDEAEQERKEQEQQERERKERKERDEKEREILGLLERERKQREEILEQMERDRQEREQKEKERQEREEKERQERERQEKEREQKEKARQEREEKERQDRKRQEAQKAEPEPQRLIPQTFDVPAKPLILINKKFKTAMQWAEANCVEGHVLHGGKLQQWAFQRAGSGYAISCVATSGDGTSAWFGLGTAGNQLKALYERNRKIWVVQPAGWNTFRIAKVDEPTQCLELSNSSSGSSIVINSHATDATQQLWELMPLPAQTLNISTRPLLIVNKKYQNAIQWTQGRSIESHTLHRRRRDQQWVFERIGSGYGISSGMDTSADETAYLGVGSAGVLKTYYKSSGKIWTVQPAAGNTFRIVRANEPLMCLEESSQNAQVLLKPYNADSTQQLWEFVPVGKS